MKRWFFTVMALMMLLAGLFGCSSSNTNSDGSSGKPTYSNDKVINMWADCPPLAYEARLRQYKDAGFTYYNLTQDGGSINSDYYKNAFGLCKEIGLDVIVRSYDNTSGYVNNYDKKFIDDFTYDLRDYDNFVGLYMWDEPDHAQIDEIADTIVDWYNADYSDNYLWSINLYPSYAGRAFGTAENMRTDGTAYENYVNTYVDKVLSKVEGKKYIGLDHYGMSSGSGRKYISDSMLYDYIVVKKAADRVGADFTTCVQTYEGPRKITMAAEVRFHMFLGLCCGCVNFEFYTYLTTGTETAMVEGSGALNDLYYYVKEVNTEIHKLEQTYLSFKWNGIYTVVGSENEEGFCDAFDAVAQFALPKLDGVESVKSRYDTLIGAFSDEQKRNGYMVLNYTEPTDKLLNVVEMNVGNYKNALVYQGGEPIEYKTVKGKLTLRLQPGEAVFVIPY